MIQIRLSQLQDLPALMSIYQQARAFMTATGNAHQWINGYPSSALMEEEIQAGHSYVCLNEQEEIIGTFCFILGEDPTYQQIYGGEWLNDEPYGVIHRLASNGSQPGIAQHCIEWCAQHINNLRVDTHQDNQIMQRILIQNGFLRCGTILVKNGTERIAFQRKTSK